MKKNYEIRLSIGVVRDLKKMVPALRDFIYTKIYEIAEAPYKNERLSDPFKELRSQHSKFRGAIPAYLLYKRGREINNYCPGGKQGKHL